MADILFFHQNRKPASDREPEPLRREVLSRSLRAAREVRDVADRAEFSSDS
jgi:hypothetical protein